MERHQHLIPLKFKGKNGPEAAKIRYKRTDAVFESLEFPSITMVCRVTYNLECWTIN